MGRPEDHDRGASARAVAIRGAPRGDHGVDELKDAWRAAATEVQTAYTTWTHAGRGGRGEAYAVYRAAVERETRACSLWVSLTERRRRLGPGA